MGENLNWPCTHWSRPTSSVLVNWFCLMWLVVPGPTGGWGRRQRSLASGGFFTAASQIQSHGMRFSYIFIYFPWFPRFLPYSVISMVMFQYVSSSSWCVEMFTGEFPGPIAQTLAGALDRVLKAWSSIFVQSAPELEVMTLSKTHTHTHSAYLWIIMYHEWYMIMNDTWSYNVTYI